METDFYHRCWLVLKTKYPRLRKRMDEVEMNLAGLSQLPVKTVRPKKDENDDESLGEIV